VLLTVHRLPHDVATTRHLVAAGAAMVEVDVQLYRGELRASHAVPMLDRLPYLRIDGWRLSASLRPPGRPLGEVLAELPADLSVSFDLKNERGEAALELARRLVADVRPPPGSWVASKHRGSLAIAQAAGWPTMLSIGDQRALRDLLAGSRLDAGQPADALAVRHTLLTREVFDQLVRSGHPPVIAWVVDDVRRARELAGWGAFGITSDNREVFAALTNWPDQLS
jgi:glycerophosphoryl diester phosphodiesterase